MQNVLAFKAEHLQLSAAVPMLVRQMVQLAIESHQDKPTAEKYFKMALSQAPAEMEIYVAFYKFYFYQNQLVEAEQIATQALQKIAELTGLPADWRRFKSDQAHWSNPDSPVRYYLYTLKALGFIALRRENLPLANAILEKLAELDPHDRVGASVINALASRMSQGDEYAS